MRARKVFCRNTSQHIIVVVIIKQEQAAFRKGRLCINDVFTLRKIMEQCLAVEQLALTG
jgi:hypothetical protein